MNDDPKKIEEIWLAFVGVLDLPIARSLVNEFTTAITAGVKRVHFLIQSPGGNVNEGVFLLNFITKLPIDVFAYNCGHVGSAAVISYLGAKKRIVSPNGTFLIHRAKAGHGNVGTSGFMSAVANSLEIDDTRTSSILSEQIILTKEQQDVASCADLTLNATDAVIARIAHEIGYFSPNGILRTV